MSSTALEKMTVRLSIQVKKVLFFILLQEIMSATDVNAVEEPSVTSTSRSAVFVSRRNTRLVGHAIKWFYSPSLLSCSQLCLSKTWCASINFKMSSKKDAAKGTCELNKHNWPLCDEYGILQSQYGVIFALLLRVSSGCYFLNKLLFQLVKTGSNTFYLWFTLKQMVTISDLFHILPFLFVLLWLAYTHSTCSSQLRTVLGAVLLLLRTSKWKTWITSNV